jgi:PAS domain-containing protein
MPAYWKSRFFSVYSAVAGAGHNEQKRSVLRSTIGSIGIFVVLVTSLTPPIMVLLCGYFYERQLVTILAHERAAHLGNQFSADSTLSSATVRPQRSAGGIEDPHQRFRAERIFDGRGSVVMQIGGPPASPVVVGKSQIVAKDRVLGEVEVTTSLRPLLLFVGSVLLMSCIFGGLSYVLARVVPLRVLDGIIDKLEERNWQLDAALSNMPLGIAMFNANRRLVVHNDHYREMYGFAAELTLIEKTADELNRIRLEAGIYGKIPAEEFYRERHAAFGAAAMRLQKLGDGRVIEVVQRCTPNGGVVITHQDVTEREHLHAALAQREEQLRIALDNMVQGLCMFDGEQRVVVANPIYARMYGMTLD